ncbi:MAG: PTS sugar transporter subunit IIB [Erysipelotrichaceae bacterium]|nr:PTS sugar transporter subunit IIB [Erysipelotrichaceae bacterium]
MNIVFARIDNRLLHGIVMTQYLPSSGAKRIMVIDDGVANDPLKKDMMNMAKPSGMASSIITFDKAVENIKADKYGDQPIFFLTKSPVTVLKIAELGVKFPFLMIGCTDMLNKGHKLSSRAFLTDEELEACRKLRDMGTRITVQHAPSTPEVDMWKIVQ